MAKVYVASSFANKDEVRVVMSLLQGAGYSIAHDWTSDEYPEDNDPAKEWKLTQMAQECQDGVRRARFLVYLHHPAARGAWVEIGMALSLRMRVYIVAPHVAIQNLPIFAHFSRVRVVDSVEAVLEAERW